MTFLCYVGKTFNPEHTRIIDQANSIIEDYQAQGYDLTLRQLYYRFVAMDAIPNTIQSYKRLGGIISDARRAGLVSWSAIVDRTRKLGVNSHWEDAGSIVNSCAAQFRLDRWEGQKFRPEVWVEKDALVGVIERTCRDLDIPFHSCRGYPSDSMVWGAARRMTEDLEAHPVVIHLGDHDPSGVDMTRDIRERLHMFAREPIDVIRVALTMDQVEEYAPPPNPAKLTDSRCGAYLDRYGRSSWELDALEPAVLDEVIRTEVARWCDESLYQDMTQREADIRAQLSLAADNWDGIMDGLND